MNVKVKGKIRIKMKIKSKTCWVYVLECGDGSYYTGWTNDLAKRVTTHQAGKGGKYTRSRLPVRLIMKWKAENRNEAMGREARFKSLNRREKEKALKSRR